MKLEIVQQQFVDFAWRDGASSLEEASNTVGDITGSQLKMMLARGERILVRLMCDEKIVGWGVCRIDPLPNVRVMHITELVCHNNHFEQFFEEFCAMARTTGASEVRFSGKDAQCRLFAHKCGFEKVYTTMRYSL